MKLKRISLTDKFVILFILMGVVAAGIVSGMAYFLAKDALMSRTFDQLTSVKSVKKKQIENFFEEREKDLSLLIKFLENIIRQNEEGEYSIEPGIKDFEFLNHYIKGRSFYNNFHLIDANGSIVSCDPMKNIYSHSEILKYFNVDSSFIDDIQIAGKDSLRFLVTGSPIYYNNQKIAVLVLEINLQSINSIMLEKKAATGLGESGESYLVGPDYLMRSASRFQLNSIMKVKVETQGVKKAFEGLSETDVFLDYRGLEVLSSYCKLNIDGLEWVLMAEIDLKEAMAPIVKIRNYILFLTVSISLIVFFIAFIISMQISKPLKNLTRAVEQIGKGDFKAQVETVSHDEIGDLTNAFNLMSRQLEKNREDLKKERLERYSIATDAQEQERERLSRELHDGIGQTFIAIKLKLEQIFSKEGNSDDSAIQDIENSFDNAIDEIRRMSNNLTPSVLREFGLENAIRKLSAELQEYGDYCINFEYNLSSEISSKKANIYLYRIVGEALNNILKHSMANEVIIRIFERDGNFKLVIKDNGGGFNFDNPTRKRGAGLFNIKERAQILGGIAIIDAEPGIGVRITVTIPGEKIFSKND